MAFLRDFFGYLAQRSGGTASGAVVEDQSPKLRGAGKKSLLIFPMTLLLLFSAAYAMVRFLRQPVPRATVGLRSAGMLATDVANTPPPKMDGAAVPTADPRPTPTVQQMQQPAMEDPVATELRRQALEQRLKATSAPVMVQPGGVGPSGFNPGAQALLAGLTGAPMPMPNTASSLNVPHAEPFFQPGPGINPFIVPQGSMNRAEGVQYFVPEGTMLRCTLANALDGEMTGPVTCVLREPVVSLNGQHVLIPVTDAKRPGFVSHLDGETGQVSAFGQRRLRVVFHKLYMPDQYQVWFDDKSSQEALDSSGASGIKGHVNNHYLSTFGASLAIGLLGAAGEVGTGTVLSENGAGRLLGGTSVGLSWASMEVLSKFLNRMPTITVPVGTPVAVYLAGDYQLPEYAQHRMPEDF